MHHPDTPAPDGKQRVSSAELVRNISYWQERALDTPIVVTYHGRDRLILGPVGVLSEAAKANGAAPGFDAVDAITTLSFLKETMEEGFALVDRRLVFLDINATACQWLGMPRELVLGRTLKDVMPTPDGEFFTARLQRTMRTGEADYVDYASKDFPGRRVEVRLHPHVSGAIVLFRNITRESDMLAEIAAHQSLLAGISAHGRIATLRLDAAGRILGPAPALSAWTGAAEDALAEVHFASLMIGQDRSVFQSALRTVVRTFEPAALTVRLVTGADAELTLDLALSATVRDERLTDVAVLAVRL